MEKKRKRQAKKLLSVMFTSMGQAYIRDEQYTINWADGTATTKGPAGQIVTYKNK
jgi:hypothetical protein